MAKLTEFSVSQQQLKEYIDTIRENIGTTMYLFTKGEFYYWRDGIWLRVEENQIESKIEALAKDNYAIETVGRNTKNEMIAHIQASTFMSAEMADQRTKPELVAFKNGYIDLNELKAGNIKLHNYDIEDLKGTLFFELIPHNINIEMLEKIKGTIEPSPETILQIYSPKVYGFFESLVGPEKIKLQLMKIGYCFYRGNPHKLCFMELGESDSGKTTYLNFTILILGCNNVATVSIQDLSNKEFSEYRLYHKLANVFDELTTEMIRSTSKIKMLSGESRIGANRKFKEPIEFYNYAKPIFSANKLPDVKQTDDDAFFSRWIITKYTNKFIRNDGFFKDLTSNEADIEATIIAALYALKYFLEQGKPYVDDGTTDYAKLWKRNINTVFDFIETSIEAGKIKVDKSNPELKVTKEILYNAYTMWCSDQEVEAVKKTSFTQELERLYSINAKARLGAAKATGYSGIELVEPDDTESSGQGGLNE